MNSALAATTTVSISQFATAVALISLLVGIIIGIIIGLKLKD